MACRVIPIGTYAGPRERYMAQPSHVQKNMTCMKLRLLQQCGDVNGSVAIPSNVLNQLCLDLLRWAQEDEELVADLRRALDASVPNGAYQNMFSEWFGRKE